ncbi:MAG: guanylate kinase [Dehalococcoidia bacterium]
MIKEMSSSPPLVVITGPSGVGKDTILDTLTKELPNLYVPITATTRKPRPNEIHGIDQLFYDNKEFDLLIENDSLIEWAEVYGERYGVPKSQVDDARSLGKDIIVRTDVQGAFSIRNYDSSSVLIFISPPSLDSLEERLKSRGGNSVAQIQSRLSSAKGEIEKADLFDYVIVNKTDNLDETVRELKVILAALRFSIDGNKI